MRWSPSRLRDSGYLELEDGRVARRDLLAPGDRVKGGPPPAPPSPAPSPAPYPWWSPPSPLDSWSRRKLGPELSLQVAVVESLWPRALAARGLLFLVGGELPGGGKLFRKWQGVRRWLGYLPGQPDLLLLWPDAAGVGPCRCGVLELKRPAGDPDLLGHRKARGEPTPEQRALRAWAALARLPHATPRSVDEAHAALDAWGFPAPRPPAEP